MPDIKATTDKEYYVKLRPFCNDNSGLVCLKRGSAPVDSVLVSHKDGGGGSRQPEAPHDVYSPTTPKAQKTESTKCNASSTVEITE